MVMDVKNKRIKTTSVRWNGCNVGQSGINSASDCLLELSPYENKFCDNITISCHIHTQNIQFANTDLMEREKRKEIDRADRIC